MSEALIIDCLRTGRAKKKGKLAGVHAVDLLTYPLNQLINRNNIPADAVEDLLVGCVTQTAEQGWCIARRAVLAAGWPYTVPANTINRLCGSGQQALNFAASAIKAGEYQLAVAGGVEHMTRVPMFSDCGGEESPLLKKHHPDLVQQGLAAEILAERFKVTREDSDAIALLSQQRAEVALTEKRFAKSLVEVPYTETDGSLKVFNNDDNPRFGSTAQALSGLKTVFKADGVITAGNASAIVDGAACILLASEKKSAELKLKPRARIVSQVSIGSDPLVMLSGPVEASKQALKRAGLCTHEIDIFEINEAFAPVVVYTIRELGLDPAKVNPNGGAIALGHPLGATGAVLILTALDELERTAKRYALVTMCIGLGMGIATIIERL